MNTPLKLGAYVLGLGAVFGLAAGAGNAVGPIGSAGGDDADAAAHSDTAGHGGGGHSDTGSGSDHGVQPDAELPAGLMVSNRGYTLELDSDSVAAGRSTPVSFRITDPHGDPVTAFEETHDEELHLIAVRRDMTGFQHVHPTRDDSGTWRVPLALTPGEWRFFADFAVPEEDDGFTLGADVSVAGAYAPQPLPAPAPVAEVGEYSVTLDGTLVPGEQTLLTLTVSKNGEPVTDLEPYLAAYGHLVALRDGDLAYLHVHPEGEPGDGVTPPGPEVAFYVTAPSAGDYRLFLDFKHEGVVRTAEFTVHAGDTDDHQPTGPDDDAAGHDDHAAGPGDHAAGPDEHGAER